jgi:hypothetical protein
MIGSEKEANRQKQLKKVQRRGYPLKDDHCPECLTEDVSFFPSYINDCQTCLKSRLSFLEKCFKI